MISCNLSIRNALECRSIDSELELLLCGVREYKLSELKKYHTVVSNDIFFGRTLKWFWAALEGFSSEQFAKLLQFTTGSSQLPPGGFAELSPMFQGCSYNFLSSFISLHFIKSYFN